MTTCFQYLLSLHEVCCFQTRSSAGVGLASKSEIRRWFQQKSVRLNWQLIGEHDELPPIVVELTLFPKSDKRVTLMRECSFIHVKEDLLEATAPQTAAC